MKTLSSILVLVSFSFIQSCGCKQHTPDPNIYETAENSESSTTTDVLEQQTLTGSFRSVKGVMDKLSCYTSNGGYITLVDGSTVAVSFKDSEDVSSCDKITVTGYMTSRSIESNGSCPAGMMGFLKVQSYIVGETDY